ncbi:hypothetical protein CEW92_04910 [Bacillaceae bacterium SAS-127]|nr:hypothetical protein CEW92_04910 [Bacillaceae bacterium SAS-127]
MILIDNRNYLRLNNRPLLERLAEQEEHVETVIIEPSKRGLPTLKLTVDEKTQYVYSKYDPAKEVERLHKQKEMPENTKHVLFFGAGLGYQIQVLLNEYPDMDYSIYEPNVEVLVQLLSHQNLNDLCSDQLQKLFTTTKQEQLRSEIQQLYQLAGSNIYVYTLPVYEKLYAEELKTVMETIKELLKNKSINLVTTASYQIRWTLNSIKNFPFVFDTPNILHNMDKGVFADRPAIIVAAGPSLSEEFENLKYIKENGLAYIFSVGSAINALIEHEIYPDAACTYDPTEKNQIVFEKLKAKNIDFIPLIFGSSVGFETLQNYPGPLLHMITSQDTVSPQLLDTSQNIDIVLDAPSIAVVTFQLLKLLGCHQIILAGQNLAYPNNQRYAKEIKYDHVSSELSKAEMEELIAVKDVFGNDVPTNESFNLMRKQLEWYISTSPELEVINTTRGGAHISGTTFLPLSEVVQNKLLKKNVVLSKWYKVNNQYTKDYTQKQLRKIKDNQNECKQSIESARRELKKVESTTQQRQLNRLEQRFAKFDKEFSKLKQNSYYQAFIEPMLQVQNKLLSEKSQSIRYENDPIKKGNTVVEAFSKFLNEVQVHFEFVLPHYQELQERLENIISQKGKDKDES